MNPQALEKAKARLDAARAASDGLNSSQNYATARLHWDNFVVAAGRVFSVLEQGAKDAGGTNWIGPHKQRRRSDPLLSYLFHARNSLEHDLPSITEEAASKMVMVEDGKVTATFENTGPNRSRLKLPEGQKTWEPQVGKQAELRMYPKRAKLIPVRDRGVTYQPPVEHLGIKLEDNEPATVALTMLAYLEKMVLEAEQ